MDGEMKAPKRIQAIWKEALAAQKKAYAPYSHYPVGATLLTKDGIRISGCNIENASFTSTCAERVALFKAHFEGRKNFTDLMVVTNTKGGAFPCGVCLQILSEHCPPSMTIWAADKKGIHRKASFRKLFPMMFQPKALA